MDRAEFNERVARAGEIDDPEPVTTATLETLGETLSSGQAADIATYLPDEYTTSLTDASEDADTGNGSAGTDASSISRETFIERVHDRAAEYAESDPPDATDELPAHIAAVTDALAESIPRDEQRGLRSQLSDDVESLFTDGDGGR